MPIYEIRWSEEVFYTQVVEADSAEEAQFMLLRGDFDWPDPDNIESTDYIYVEVVDADL